jgi:curved DNA-binding protein CbpA
MGAASTPGAAGKPAPSASGTLEGTPLVQLLLYASEKKLTGTFELTGPGPETARAAVRLVAGDPAKVKTSEPGPYLGGILLELGYLDGEQLTSSLGDLAKAKSAGGVVRHGDILLAAGLVNGEQLDRGLREQVVRKLRQAGELPASSTFAYYDRFDGLRDWGPDMPRGFDAWPIVWALLRESRPSKAVTSALERVARAALKLPPAVDLARFGFDKDERSAAELLRIRPMLPAELIAAGVLPESRAQMLVYLLVATKQLEITHASSAAVPAQGAPSPGPMKAAQAIAAAIATATARTPAAARTASNSAAAALTASTPAASAPARGPEAPPHSMPLAQVTDRRREIVERAASLDRTDYFTLLGVPQTVTSEEVEKAFFALARRWHPDGVPPMLADVRDDCARVFARMVEASKTLGNDQKRAYYRQALAAAKGARTGGDSQSLGGAEDLLAEAKGCFLRQELQQAERLCRDAMMLDSTIAECHALLAWLVAQKPEGQSESGTRECIQVLDRAIAMDDKCDSAYFWRAQLFKRIGRTNSAASDFKRAAELNPGNLEAVRELRLYGIRGGDVNNPRATRTDMAHAKKALDTLMGRGKKP